MIREHLVLDASSKMEIKDILGKKNCSLKSFILYIGISHSFNCYLHIYWGKQMTVRVSAFNN